MRIIVQHRTLILYLGMLSCGLSGCAGAPGERTAASNTELAAIYDADQADRSPGTAPGDWSVVQRNDLARESRVRQLLEAGEVKSGRDYYHAAMVFQHASDAEGIQLAHELAMIGASMGDKDSRWLAAASYDRFLMYLKRPQRFGTQYRSGEDGVMRLYEVGEGTTDSMRAALNVPSLVQSREREEAMQRELESLRQSTPTPK